VCGGLPAGQGITTEGAFRDGAGVRPAGAGETLLPPGFEAVAARLAEAGIAARVEPQIVAARLAKLLMNVVINPLAAIFRVPNGAVLELPQRPLFDALLAEAWPVLRAEGLALDEAAARERVIAVARATAPTGPACCRTCWPAGAPRSTRSPAACWRWPRAGALSCPPTGRYLRW